MDLLTYSQQMFHNQLLHLSNQLLYLNNQLHIHNNQLHLHYNQLLHLRKNNPKDQNSNTLYKEVQNKYYNRSKHCPLMLLTLKLKIRMKLMKVPVPHHNK